MGLIKLARVCLLYLFAGIVFSAQQGPPPQQVSSQTSTDQQDSVLPGDWAPELFDGILSSPNSDAAESLYRAAFAAGPAIIPQLEMALKDDRTAEFAAQSLAFTGGPKALEILSRLVDDPRDLDLRRFFYGALGEFTTPQATQVLVDAVKRADREPDRTVTEAAILALTARSDSNLVPKLREAEAKINDVVIRDDLDNALEVIGKRAQYLATPEGKKGEVSIERAVRTYFMPALEPPSPSPSKSPSSLPPQKPRPEPRPQTGRDRRIRAESSSSKVNPKVPPGRALPQKALISVEIKTLALSPDKTRALAQVVFEDPSAMAYYDIVLQKHFGDWVVASVWLGPEIEKTPTAADPPSSDLE